MKHPSTIVIAASLLGALALPAGAQQSGSTDGGVVVKTSPGQATAARTRKITATVEAVDTAKREVTVKGPSGKSTTFSVAPEVRNFDQVKAGDTITLGYMEALTLTLTKGGKEVVRTTDATGATAQPGQKPGGVVAAQVKVTADVTAIDTKTQMVTLRGPKQEVDLHVADPAQLKLIKVGDQVDAVYTQALALSVDAAPAKK